MYTIMQITPIGVRIAATSMNTMSPGTSMESNEITKLPQSYPGVSVKIRMKGIPINRQRMPTPRYGLNSPKKQHLYDPFSHFLNLITLLL